MIRLEGLLLQVQDELEREAGQEYFSSREEQGAR
jgi:hypothetical protein